MRLRSIASDHNKPGQIERIRILLAANLFANRLKWEFWQLHSFNKTADHKLTIGKQKNGCISEKIFTISQLNYKCVSELLLVLKRFPIINQHIADNMLQFLRLFILIQEVNLKKNEVNQLYKHLESELHKFKFPVFVIYIYLVFVS